MGSALMDFRELGSWTNEELVHVWPGEGPSTSELIASYFGEVKQYLFIRFVVEDFSVNNTEYYSE